MIEELIANDCIKIGNFQLKNGETSKYYYDIKNIISSPALVRKVGDKLYNLLGDFDIVCGVPYGGLPIATYISITYNKPLIYMRDKVKAYGTGKLIEGTYKISDRCVIIDDVITSGKSVEDTIQYLKDKVNVVEIGVIVDRQQNYTCSMPVKTVFYKNDIVKYYLEKISREKKSKLCFSADIEDPKKLLKILDKIGKNIVICKIHFDILQLTQHYLSENEFIKELIESSIKHNFLIMEDRKFVDISHIVNKQYARFSNWVDLVTVHASVAKNVVSKMSGVLLVANMSNNDYDLTTPAIAIAKANQNNIVGFITQYRINLDDMICMTPGISLANTRVGDQRYKTVNEVDTDYIIVGRALYNSENIEEDIKKFL